MALNLTEWNGCNMIIQLFYTCKSLHFYVLFCICNICKQHVTVTVILTTHASSQFLLGGPVRALNVSLYSGQGSLQLLWPSSEPPAHERDILIDEDHSI